MCMCGKPTLNGEPGYSWDGKTRGAYPINPPNLSDGDEIVFDEPGRCGGLDSHSHHLRVVKAKYGRFRLLIRHGGGDECIELGSTPMAIAALGALDSNARYWLLLMLYHVQHDAVRQANDICNARWRKAAAEKRIKTRRLPSRGTVKVWVEEPAAPTQTQ